MTGATTPHDPAAPAVVEAMVVVVVGAAVVTVAFVVEAIVGVVVGVAVVVVGIVVAEAVVEASKHED